MARTDTLPHFLTDVADAIRTKSGTSGTIQASTFDTAIANIPSGGGGSLTMAYADITLGSSQSYGQMLQFTISQEPKMFILVINADASHFINAGTGTGTTITNCRFWNGITEYAIESQSIFKNAGQNFVNRTDTIITNADKGQFNPNNNMFTLSYVYVPSQYVTTEALNYRLYYFY